MVLPLPHGLRGLLMEVAVEELVVQEHASEVGYPGVIDPVRGTIKGLYPPVREHQRELRQVRIDTEEGPADPAAECFDLVALERVVGEATTKFFKALSPDVGDVVEAVTLLQGLVREGARPTAREGLLGEHVQHLRRNGRIGVGVEVAEEGAKSYNVRVGVVEELVYIRVQAPPALLAEAFDEVLLKQSLGPSTSPFGIPVGQPCLQHGYVVVP